MYKLLCALKFCIFDDLIDIITCLWWLNCHLLWCWLSLQAENVKQTTSKNLNKTKYKTIIIQFVCRQIFWSENYGMHLAALVPRTIRVCFKWHFFFESIYVGISKKIHAVHFLLNNIIVFLRFFSFLHFSCTRTLFCVVPIECNLE